ncbi:hypothetical protein [Lysobacter gummosus]|uniref:hypothetical protein n=1 Tax=Lysobacter gummosus TaxID=262324 RepID=UPI0036408ECC
MASGRGNADGAKQRVVGCAISHPLCYRVAPWTTLLSRRGTTRAPTAPQHAPRWSSAPTASSPVTSSPPCNATAGASCVACATAAASCARTSAWPIWPA